MVFIIPTSFVMQIVCTKKGFQILDLLKPLLLLSPRQDSNLGPID